MCDVGIRAGCFSFCNINCVWGDLHGLYIESVLFMSGQQTASNLGRKICSWGQSIY